MVDYLKRKWQLLATIGGLVVVVLVLVFVIGGSETANAPASDQQPAQTPDDGAEPAEPQENNQGPAETGNQIQVFAVQIEQLELEITFLGIDCQPLSELAAQFVGDKTPAEIQAAFEKYEQGVSTLPQDEAWELYDIAGALDYMVNLKNHLGQTQPGAAIDSGSIYQSLGLYKECVVSLTAKNQGQDSVFSNGCGLTIDSYVTANDDQGQQHRPLYLGSAIACTEAEVPFVAGDSVETGVVFSLLLETELSSITIQNDRPNSEPIVIDLPTEPSR